MEVEAADPYEYAEDPPRPPPRPVIVRPPPPPRPVVVRKQVVKKRVAPPRIEEPDFSTNRSCMHLFFILYGFTAGVTAALLGLAQMIGLSIPNLPTGNIHLPHEIPKLPDMENFTVPDVNFTQIGNEFDTFKKDVEALPTEIHEGWEKGWRIILAIYIMFNCILALLTELGWCRCLINSRILHWWFTRGILYMLLGYLSLYQLTHATKDNHKNHDQSIFITDASYAFMGVGAGYAVMGLCCGQVYLHRIRLDYRARRYGYKTSATRNPDLPSDLVYDVQIV